MPGAAAVLGRLSQGHIPVPWVMAARLDIVLIKLPSGSLTKCSLKKTASETLTPLKPMGFLPWSAVGQGFLPASPHSTLGCDVSRHRAMPALQGHSKAGCMLSIETRLNGKKCMQPFPKFSLLKPRRLQQHEL